MKACTKALLLAMASSLVAWIASARPGHAGDEESTFLPWLAAGFEGAVSGMQVQNPSDDTMDLEIDLFGPLGGLQSISRPGLEPGSATNLYLGSGSWRSDLLAGIARSDGQIASIVRTDWPAHSAAAIYSSADAADEIIVPVAMKRYFGQCTVAAIQNTDVEQSTVVEVALLTPDHPAAGPFAVAMAPGSSVLFDLCNNSELAAIPEGFLGSLSVRSESTRIAVQVLGFDESNPRTAVGFEGLPTDQSAERIFAPLIRNAFYGSTGISVVNPNDASVSVTVTYSASPITPNCRGRTVHGDGPAEIPPRSSLVFLQHMATPGAGDPGLPSGCLGAARIESSGGGVMAVVNDADRHGDNAAAYVAIPETQGARRVAIPLYRDRHTEHRLSTGVQAMNIGEDVAHIEFTMFDAAGNKISDCFVDCLVTLGPMDSYLWYPAGLSSAKHTKGHYGSALLVSDQPLAVVVNDTSELGTVDSAIYNGIPIDGG